MKYGFDELLEQPFIKETWARSDEYYQFTFDKFSTFGARLKKWRELNHISQKEMAEAIYNFRYDLDYEDDDVSNESLSKDVYDSWEANAIDFETEKKLEQKKERRITSLYRAYHKWEEKETGYSFADTPFSLINLYVLKQLLNCDYEFLFCETKTPHKETANISESLGLNISTVEKLMGYNRCPQTYTDNIMKALNKLLSDDDLLAYLSWYITNPYIQEIKNSSDKDFNTIYYNIPSGGSFSEDGALDGEFKELDFKEINFVYLLTIANKLNLLQTKESEESVLQDDLPLFDNIVLAEDDDSFGERLKKWREYNHYSQRTVAERIYNYRKDNNLFKINKGEKYLPEFESVIRTYQNWEAKDSEEKELRLSMTDLYILKKIMGCDYEYLFGEINTLNVPNNNKYKDLGLNPKIIEKLENYARSIYEKEPNVPAYANRILRTIDLIVSDNELMSLLTTYLTDVYLLTDMQLCEVLRPILGPTPHASLDEYSRYLFNDNSNELKNLLMPEILKKLEALNEHYRYTLEPALNADW